MVSTPLRVDVQALRRDLTRTLAEAIAAVSGAPDDVLARNADRYEALLGAARSIASGHAQAGPVSALVQRPAVLVVDPERGRNWKAPEYDLLAVARDALQGLAFAQELRPDAVIYRLPGYSFNDVSAIAELAQVGIVLQVIVLVQGETDRRRLAAVRRPRLTLLPADADRATIDAALGVVPIDHTLGAFQTPQVHDEDRLTTREHEVLHLMAAGKANKQIASDLGVSIATAKYHVANILRKLGAANRAQALVKAYEGGLLLR